MTTGDRIQDSLLRLHSEARTLYGDGFPARCAPYRELLQLVMERERTGPTVALASILADLHDAGIESQVETALFAASAVEITWANR